MNQLKQKTIPVRKRRGITLIEVLIAVGVAAVGMFGVFVLIPMCARQAQLGQTYDEASAVAKSAVERFQIDGMGDPDKWRRTDPTVAAPIAFPIRVANTPDSGDAGAVPDWKENAFCLDPQRLSRDGTNHMFPTSLTVPGTSQRAPGRRLIERITYSKVFGGSAANTQAMASLLFQTEDDLTFKTPDDKQQLPAQNYFLNGNGPMVRANNGKMSWMAMFEPQPGVTGSELYRLYIVVFQNRYLDTNSDVERPYEERIFEPNVNPANSEVEIVGGGISGGEFILKKTIVPNFRIRKNSWVMLQSTTNQAIFAWYRVVRADENPDGDPGGTPANFPETYVTLEGGDWPFPQAQTRAIFIPEVVMVYEKTIKLGDDSMYSID